MSTLIKKSISDLLEKTHSAGKEFSAGIESIRSQIEELKSEREVIARHRSTEAVAHERIDAWVKGLSIDAMDHAPQPSRFTPAEDRWKPPAYPIEASFFAYLGPTLAKEVKRRVSELYQNSDDPGITETERELRFSRIDREILDAEMAEESIIRAAEAAGFPVFRRVDADPRAVLAHDKVLP